MLYIQRNADGKLKYVKEIEFEGMTGTLPVDHPDILAWVNETGLMHLEQSDLDMIRVLEDLIALLITKGAISITDMPAAARVKLLNRDKVRKGLSEQAPLIDDAEEPGLI